MIPAKMNVGPNQRRTSRELYRRRAQLTLRPAAAAAAAGHRYVRPSMGLPRRGHVAVAARAVGAGRALWARAVWRRREGLRAGSACARDPGRHSTLGAGPPGEVPAVLDGRLYRASVAACDAHARYAGTGRAVGHRQRAPVGIGLAGEVELDRS